MNDIPSKVANHEKDKKRASELEKRLEACEKYVVAETYDGFRGRLLEVTPDARATIETYHEIKTVPARHVKFTTAK